MNPPNSSPRWSHALIALGLLLALVAWKRFDDASSAGSSLHEFGRFGDELAGDLQRRMREQAIALGAAALALSLVGVVGNFTHGRPDLRKRAAVTAPLVVGALVALFIANIYRGLTIQYPQYASSSTPFAFGFAFAAVVAVGLAALLWRRSSRWFPSAPGPALAPVSGLGPSTSADR